MTAITFTVSYDGTTATYSGANTTGDVTLNPNESDTITWDLDTTTARTYDFNGIAITPASNRLAPYTIPTQTASQIQVMDSDNNTGDSDINYSYTISFKTKSGAPAGTADPKIINKHST